jgi:hypothetical protein
MPVKIPDGYEKHFMINDDKKVFDVYYNPNEKDSLKAYIKIEVK